MSTPSLGKGPLFVSFSGIDGAGKSTQIRALCAAVQERGLRFKVIAFWDDVAKFTRIREGAGHKVFRGDKGVGSPSAPINRRDKNVRSRLMSCIRLGSLPVRCPLPQGSNEEGIAFRCGRRDIRPIYLR